MPREQFQTLSEPMYYILLALMEECCGTDVMKQVADISGGRVLVGPGTVYALLDKFQKNGIIKETTCRGRKRFYRITEQGKERLQAEYRHLKHLLTDGAAILEDMS